MYIDLDVWIRAPVNAIYGATGKGSRSLPVTKEKLVTT
jgi:CO/xanthine dehydrogenase Mo-binding subunit